MDQGDKLPQFICDLCFEQLKYAKQLRNNSLKSDKILKNDMPAFATFTIKAEPVEEQPIDDSIEYPQLDLIVKFEAELPTIQEPIISCDQQENVSEIMYTDICDANSNEVLEKAVDEEEDSDGLGDLVIPPKRIKIRRRKSQHVVKSWDCSFCEETFNCNKKFWKHIEEHKLAKEKTPFDCTNCGRGFFVESVFKNHKCISKLRCQICDTNFESFKNLLAHLRNLHLEDKKCEKCNIELQSARHLHYHIRDHDKLLAYNCEMCGKLFKNRKAILSHINKSHRKMPDFSCDLCGSQIKNKSTLRHHMDSIHLKQQCLCPHCARTFKSNDTLNMHLIQRHGAPPAVTCTKCKKGFLYVSQLNLHNLQKHLGERNKTAQQMDENDPRIIKCGVCRRKFLRLENLRRHQAEYCGEVTTGGTRQINRKVFKYKCRFCFKSFK